MSAGDSTAVRSCQAPHGQPSHRSTVPLGQLLHIRNNTQGTPHLLEASTLQARRRSRTARTRNIAAVYEMANAFPGSCSFFV